MTALLIFSSPTAFAVRRGKFDDSILSLTAAYGSSIILDKMLILARDYMKKCRSI